MPERRTDHSAGDVRRLTIEDVAAAAGVSVATVSRALRGLPNVTEATRDRVRQVALELDYRPDPAAARLAAGRTGTVTVAIPSLNGWYFSTVVAGAESVCAAAGFEFQVIAVSTPAQRDRLVDESHRVERRTDALILVDITVSPEQAASLTRRNVGLAMIGSHVPGHPSVRIDDHAVGRLAAEHLVSLGHRRIAVIGGEPDNPMSFDVPVARWEGFTSAAASAGVTVTAGDMRPGHFTIRGGHAAMTSLLERDERPTAVFAMSDEMAFGALMALGERSLRPGVDISILGVDDHEFSRVVDLTTIHQPVAEHGSVAAQLLISTLAATRPPPVSPADDDESVAALAFEPKIELVVRSTTAPPAN